MDRPIKILKPSLINAFVPSLVKHLLRASPIIIVGYIILYFASLRTPYNLFLLSSIFLIVLGVPLVIEMVVLHFTKYYFYRDRVVSEFDFIWLKSHSVPYGGIAEVKVDISLWDKICGAGDVWIHTAENKSKDLILKYINSPHKVESAIYILIRRGRPKL